MKIFRHLPLVIAVVLFAPSCSNDGSKTEPEPSESYITEDMSKRGLEDYHHVDSDGETRPDLYRKSFQDFLSVKNGFMSSLGQTQIWEQVGPAPANVNAYISQNGQLPGPNAGSVMDIAIDPSGSTDAIVYVVSEEGGVWKTKDGGSTWTPLTDVLQTLSFGAIAIDPSTNSTLYAGTGNLFNQAGLLEKNGNTYKNYKAVGIYTSTDGGSTWSLTSGSATLNGVGINKMVMPSSGTLLVATNNGLYKSVDGGASYNPVSLGGQSTGYVTDLDIQDGNSNSIWAAVQGVGIFYSSDGGQSFGSNLWATGHGSVPNAPYLFVSMGVSSDGQTIYANAQLASGGVGVWKSSDGGGTWTDISSNATVNVPGLASWRQVSNCQCGYDQTMGVDPQDENRVYMGFQDLWLSEDGGTTWNDVSYTNTTYTVEQMHVDHHALTFSPSGHRPNSQITGIWVGNDGGVWNSMNNGKTWVAKNQGTSAVNSLATHLFRDIDMGRGSSNNGWTYGGTQDNGTSVGNPTKAPAGWPEQWSEWSGGDGSYIAVDWQNPEIAYGNWGYTHNGGAGLNANNYYSLPNASCTQGTPAAYSLVAVGPQNRKVYLAGQCGSNPTLFVSSDLGISYQSAYAFAAGITSIGLSASDSSIFYVSCTDGSINQMSMINNTVSLVNSAKILGTPSSRPALAVNPVDPKMVVAVFSGYSQQSLPAKSRHVYLSIDAGKTWKDISGGTPGAYVPDVPLYSAVIDPNTSPNSILVSSDFGVFRSFDFGLTWHVVGSNLPHTHTIKLALDPLVNPSLVKAGTFGRSIWKQSLGMGTSVFPQLSAKWMSMGNITIQNNSQDSLSYYQVFNNGTENKFAILAPGASNIAGAYGYTGVMAVRDSEGNIILAYVINGNSNQVVSISQSDVANAKSNGIKNYPGLRSFPTVRAVNNFTLSNQCTVAVKLYWITQSGQHNLIGGANPGESTTVGPVYYGGTFIATDANDNLIGVYVATDAPNQNFNVTNAMVNFWK